MGHRKNLQDSFMGQEGVFVILYLSPGNLDSYATVCINLPGRYFCTNALSVNILLLIY